ncbi:MAG: hypothetical protein SGPRY_008266, partial [Prymnesium sp.]
EIEMEIAHNFAPLPKALEILEDRGFRDALTEAMQKIRNDSTVQLELEFAAMFDQQRLVQANYDSEGD